MTAAPGLTWAHFGADGGDLLAAAAVHGIPHPPGYPLYLLLLRGWLALGTGWDQLGLFPPGDPAVWGNRLSAVTGAAGVAVTVVAAAAILAGQPRRWQWAALVGLAWLAAPLPWSQSLITEVYALHLLLTALLGTAALCGLAPWVLGLLLGMTAAHHPTALLLWPAALLLWRQTRPAPARPTDWLWVAGLAVAVPLVGYVSLLGRFAPGEPPPPVAWGYPQDWTELGWLVSGAAYRGYLFDLSAREFVGRLAGVVQVLADQFTPVGLAAVLAGFVRWETRPALWWATLLWMLPVSLYAAAYTTVDSFVYLLPAVWWLSLALAAGLAGWGNGLAGRVRAGRPLMAGLAAAGILTLTVLRLPQLDLRQDRAARDFLAAAAAIPPHALVVSQGDAETFALWYGVWGGGGLGDRKWVLVNSALYQFGWYRHLMQDVYLDVPMLGASWAEVIAAAQPLRPIIYVEQPPPEEGQFAPAGRFWQRLDP